MTNYGTPKGHELKLFFIGLAEASSRSLAKNWAGGAFSTLQYSNIRRFCTCGQYRESGRSCRKMDERRVTEMALIAASCPQNSTDAALYPTSAARLIYAFRRRVDSHNFDKFVALKNNKAIANGLIILEARGNRRTVDRYRFVRSQRVVFELEDCGAVFPFDPRDHGFLAETHMFIAGVVDFDDNAMVTGRQGGHFGSNFGTRFNLTDHCKRVPLLSHASETSSQSAIMNSFSVTRTRAPEA